MAEVAAGLYAAETVVEGAAVGALAVSKSTSPLHLTFHKISSPSHKHDIARSGHTLNIVKGKAYVIGGNEQANTVVSLTLPVASSTDGEGDLAPQDLEGIQPEFKNDDRPLDPQVRVEETRRSSFHFNRIGHTTTAIDDKLYVWGGKGVTADQSAHDIHPQSSDQFLVFDTTTNTYSTLTADTSKCRDGLPSPRFNHTATSSLHPRPASLPDGPKVTAHGTIFIHGGSTGADGGGDALSTELRDTWAFDVGTRVWTRLPDIPDPGPLEVANEGRIVHVDNRLWRLGDGFGRAMYLDLAEHDPGPPNTNTDLPGGPKTNNASVLGIGLKGDGKWQVISFGTEATDSSQTTNTTSSQLPMPRPSAGLVPITTGAGRQYLLYFMGKEVKSGELNDFWSFQTQSEGNSAAGIKDKIRDFVSRAKDSWSSGEHTWAKCELAKKSDSKGAQHQQEERNEIGKEVDAGWPDGLSDFGCDVWNDQGGNVFVIWGGRRGESVVGEGWVVTVE
ncbi:uncharacterized protein PV06_10911 [Exophiala oligosperma]|uniref:Galactose oxidase n=1 Tax=Exophiala oligosperma TaxID=215243 RepID=A0A0D2DM25_9EURO|nr:uncharacterized protein PV06_10911 [Exophiala oligosperma]KIW36789.1 hypothetical protein PV06_10911 [Exophiala oligosperma]